MTSTDNFDHHATEGNPSKSPLCMVSVEYSLHFLEIRITSHLREQENKHGSSTVEQDITSQWRREYITYQDSM